MLKVLRDLLIWQIHAYFWTFKEHRENFGTRFFQKKKIDFVGSCNTFVSRECCKPQFRDDDMARGERSYSFRGKLSAKVSSIDGAQASLEESEGQSMFLPSQPFLDKKIGKTWSISKYHGHFHFSRDKESFRIKTCFYFLTNNTTSCHN